MYGEMDLYHYYKINAAMKYKWNLSLQEVNEMLPFEREMYLDLMDEFDKKNAREQS